MFFRRHFVYCEMLLQCCHSIAATLKCPPSVTLQYYGNITIMQCINNNARQTNDLRGTEAMNAKECNQVQSRYFKHLL